MQGLAYASAIRWAREAGNAAIVSDDNSPQTLEAAINQLRDPARRLEFARNAITAGRKYLRRMASGKFTSIVCQKAPQPDVAIGKKLVDREQSA